MDCGFALTKTKLVQGRNTRQHSHIMIGQQDMKRCKVCKEPFTPRQPMAQVCSPECALSLAISNRAKAEKVASVKERKATKDKLDKLKSRSEWAREAQSAVNAWVRLRDAGKPCISCGRHHSGQNHAGHYLSTGARPELRFEPLNIHLQCAPCNTYLSGNAVLYRKSLIERIGLDKVEWLEGQHEPKKYTVDDLKAIKAEYMQKAKELRKAIE